MKHKIIPTLLALAFAATLIPAAFAAAPPNGGPREADLQASWGKEEQGSGAMSYRQAGLSAADFATTCYYSQGHEYSGTMDVQIYVDKSGCVSGFSIGFGLPRWMSSMTLNNYHTEEWTCDLYDFRP